MKCWQLTGGIPYPGWSEAKTIAELQKGYRMPKPQHIADTMWVSFRIIFLRLRRSNVLFFWNEEMKGKLLKSCITGGPSSKISVWRNFNIIYIIAKLQGFVREKMYRIGKES